MNAMNRLMRTYRMSRAALLPGVFACAVIALSSSTIAQGLADETPRELKGVGIEEKLTEQVPLDLRFKDSTGKAVQLRDYFEDGQPVILTLNYFRCPQLCSLQLRGLVSALKDMEWTVGEDFKIVTVSFAPGEGPEIAADNKKGYLNKYGRDAASDGWVFLTGDQTSIQNLTRSVGFTYNYDKQTGNYGHKAALIFLTPKGVVSRYIPDVNYKPKDIRLALVEAGEGSIGSTMDKTLLFTCFRYSSSESGYVVSAWKIMRTGGLVTVVLLIIGLVVLWLRGSKHDKANEHENWPTPDSGDRLAGEVR